MVCGSDHPRAGLHTRVTIRHGPPSRPVDIERLSSVVSLEHGHSDTPVVRLLMSLFILLDFAGLSSHGIILAPSQVRQRWRVTRVLRPPSCHRHTVWDGAKGPPLDPASSAAARPERSDWPAHEQDPVHR
jgi:hypothetical protein